jgi:hypothetical protein
MAIFRKIHTQFWSDTFVQSLSPERKYFYLYLLTNEKTKQCGIYEISTRQISYDTGYTVETVYSLLDFFISNGKILFSRGTNEIAIKNWNKYNKNPSSKVVTLVNKELATVKNKSLIQYINEPDTVSIHNTQEEEEIEREKEGEREEEAQQNDNVIYDIEKMFEKSQINFEAICMKVGYDLPAAKEILRKFHLYLTEKERYPMGRKAAAAGFERWLLNEKKQFNGTKSNLGASAAGSGKMGVSEARINAAKNW